METLYTVNSNQSWELLGIEENENQMIREYTCSYAVCDQFEFKLLYRTADGNSFAFVPHGSSCTTNTTRGCVMPFYESLDQLLFQRSLYRSEDEREDNYNVKNTFIHFDEKVVPREWDFFRSRRSKSCPPGSLAQSYSYNSDGYSAQFLRPPLCPPPSERSMTLCSGFTLWSVAYVAYLAPATHMSGYPELALKLWEAGMEPIWGKCSVLQLSAWGSAMSQSLSKASSSTSEESNSYHEKLAPAWKGNMSKAKHPHTESLSVALEPIKPIFPPFRHIRKEVWRERDAKLRDKGMIWKATETKRLADRSEEWGKPLGRFRLDPAAEESSNLVLAAAQKTFFEAVVNRERVKKSDDIVVVKVAAGMPSYRKFVQEFRSSFQGATGISCTLSETEGYEAQKRLIEAAQGPVAVAGLKTNKPISESNLASEIDIGMELLPTDDLSVYLCDWGDPPLFVRNQKAYAASFVGLCPMGTIT